MKNIAIFVLSLFGSEDRPPNDFTDATGAFHAETRQTNESCLRYLEWKLAAEGARLDKAFAFVTPNMRENGQWERFREMFRDVPMEAVPLRGNLLSDAIESIPEMYDRLADEQEACPEDDIRIHVDITGGFRHASMMMLPLIQILRYSGFQIGEVLYANLYSTPKMVEDASELVSDFTLIGGAEEFVSFGSVRQLQRYFGSAAPPERLRSLLDAMEALAETLRVCGNYEVTKASLQRLGEALRAYEASIQSAGDVRAQERFFSKLLPRIKREYAPLFSGKSQRTPAGIIRWCLRKGLLQQAVTFYTEWMPPYLIDSHLLTIRDAAIEKECRKNGKLWSSWAIYLFRNYQPFYAGAVTSGSNHPMTYQSLVPLFQKGDLEQLQRFVEGRNPKLEAFLAHVKEFCQHCDPYWFSSDVQDLPQDDPIRQLMYWTKPDNSSFHNYLYKRAQKERTTEAIIVKAMGALTKDKTGTFFTLPEADTEAEAGHNEDKPQWRRDIFSYLLDHGLLETTLPKERLLDFVERYEMFVSDLRNQFAHANADSGMIEGQQDIADTIEETLDLIEP